MKLGAEMENQKTAVYAVTEQPIVKTGTSNNLKIAVVALVALLAVGAIVISAVFIGGKIANDAIKRTSYVFHTRDGQTIEETITVTDTEEDIGLKDGTRIIYDYSKGYMVMKVTDNGKDTCYVSTFERKDMHAPAPEELHSMNQQQDNITLSPEIDYYVDKSSSVNRANLSQKSRDMCARNNIYWMSIIHKGGEGTRQSRAAKKRRCRPECRFSCQCCPRKCDFKCTIVCS